MRKLVQAGVAAAALLLAGAAHAEPSASQVEMLSFTCAGCHGPGGMSVGPASPSIAGLSVEYFIYAMEGYRDDKIPATVMNRIAKGYSDEQIRDMATYFSKQEFSSPRQDTDRKLVRRGEKVHQEACATCHADSGKTFDQDMPRLGGQWLTYIEYTMTDYFRYSRPIPRGKGTALRNFARARNSEEMAADIQALAHFYASQK